MVIKKREISNENKRERSKYKAESDTNRRGKGISNKKQVRKEREQREI